MQTNIRQAIKPLIEGYLDSKLLRGHLDVISFRSEVLEFSDSKPLAALRSFGPILEGSIRELIEARVEQIARRAKPSDKDAFALGFYVDNLREAFPKMNEMVYHCLGNLRSWRNLFSHHDPTRKQGDESKLADQAAAQQCVINMLHFLVWKYECMKIGKPEELPRSYAESGLTLTWDTSDTVAASDALVDMAQSKEDEPAQSFDQWGVASVKHRLSTLSELVAGEAAEQAQIAATTYDSDSLIKVLPMVCDLRWKRGYRKSIEGLLSHGVTTKRLKEYSCEEPDRPCPVSNGRLSAASLDDHRIMINLDAHAALILSGLGPQEMQMVLDTVNGYGRLGVPKVSGQSLRDRIGDIQIDVEVAEEDEIAKILYRNREVLAPLLARFGVPEYPWLMPTSETLPKVGQPLIPGLQNGKGAEAAKPYKHVEQAKRDTFIAEGAIYDLSTTDSSPSSSSNKLPI